jgi:hypothetical protein
MLFDRRVRYIQHVVAIHQSWILNVKSGATLNNLASSRRQNNAKPLERKWTAGRERTKQLLVVPVPYEASGVVHRQILHPDAMDRRALESAYDTGLILIIVLGMLDAHTYTSLRIYVRGPRIFFLHPSIITRIKNQRCLAINQWNTDHG